MAIAPAITAGVSVIGGLASISAKNKAAAAQRAQLSAQSRQQAVQQMATEVTLAQQQQAAQAEYQNTVLAQLAQFQQQDFALRSQQQLNALNAQQQAYALQSNQVEKQIEGQQQASQLDRNRTAIQAQADQRRQAGDTAVSQLAGQGVEALSQVQQLLTEAQRKELSLQAAGGLRTSSNEVAQQRELMKRLTTAFSAGADMDSSQVQAALQNLNEQDLADIGERLGLLDNAASAESVAANMRMLGLTTQAGLETNQRNYDTNYQGIELARQQAGVMASLGMQNAANQQATRDYSLGVQRAVNKETGTQQQQLNQQAMNTVKGASLFDYLNVAAQAANASQPLWQRAPQVPLAVDLQTPTVNPSTYNWTSYGPNMR